MAVPNHHLKKEVCISRPPYREGRHPKAIKVYTVNNESSYLIIQGVPSVGAGVELSKLCSSFGEIKVFKALDEYPCENKHTEVFLVKYQKVQSARFSKRKLDEYSFFGGILHVCYAPEYEMLQETGNKLLDRRRLVAKKMKQLANEKSTKQQQQLKQMNAQHSLTPISESSQYSKSLSEDLQQPDSLLENTQAADFILNMSTVATDNVVTTKRMPDTEIANEVFQLPLPPRNIDYPYSQRKFMGWNNYEYLKVKTAHVSLPVNWSNPVSQNSTPPSLAPSVSDPGQPGLSCQNSQIIVKSFEMKGSTPRFVPRQAVKRAYLHETTHDKAVKYNKSPGDDLRSNSFRLGRVQGPDEMPGKKRASPTPSQKSVNETISSIRNKISKVIGNTVWKRP